MQVVAPRDRTNESCLSEWIFRAPEFRRKIVAKNFKAAMSYVDSGKEVLLRGLYTAYSTRSFFVVVALADGSEGLPDIYITNYRTVEVVLKSAGKDLGFLAVPLSLKLLVLQHKVGKVQRFLI